MTPTRPRTPKLVLVRNLSKPKQISRYEVPANSKRSGAIRIPKQAAFLEQRFCFEDQLHAAVSRIGSPRAITRVCS